MPYAAECVVWDQRLGDEIGVRRLHPRIGTVAKIAVGSAVKSAFLRRHLKTGSRNRHFSRRPACGPGDAHRRNQGRIRLGQYRVWARAVVDGELRGIAARQGDGGDGGEDGAGCCPRPGSNEWQRVATSCNEQGGIRPSQRTGSGGPKMRWALGAKRRKTPTTPSADATFAMQVQIPGAICDCID